MLFFVKRRKTFLAGVQFFTKLPHMRTDTLQGDHYETLHLEFVVFLRLFQLIFISNLYFLV